MHRHRRHLRTITLVGALTLLMGMLLGGTAAAQESQTFTADLNPLNSSEASGTATVTVSGGTVTVSIQSSSMSPGLPHAQHFHIGGDNSCPPASVASAEQPYGEEYDDLISIPEAAPFYGPIKVALTTEGDTSPGSALALERFPVASDSGEINYQRSFPLPDGVTASDLDGAVIVQHGVAELFDDPSAYDPDPTSPFPPASELPFDGVISATCGQLVSTGAPVGGVSAGAGGAAGALGGTGTTAAVVLAILGVLALGAVTLRRRTNVAES